MRQSRDGLIECEIDVSGHKVPHDLGGARTIRHELEAGLCYVLKVNPTDVLPGTGSSRAFGRLVGIGLKPCDQALEIAGRQILSCHDHVGITWQPRDGFEIRTDVVGQRINRAIDHVRWPVADAHGIAVGSGAYGASNSDRAGRAGHVFDDDWLAQRRAHRLAQDSRQGIDRTASPVRNDESDRTRWVRLSRRLAGEQQRCKRRAEKCSIHPLPLSCTSHEASCLIACTYSSSPTTTPKSQRDVYRGLWTKSVSRCGVHLSRYSGAGDVRPRLRLLPV